MKHLLFVYGTLKKGHTRQKYLMDQRYLGTATLKPTHRMVYLSGYPALLPVKDGEEGSRVRGELYEIDDACVQAVDKVEGVDHGLFKRVAVTLAEHIPVMLPSDQQIYNLLENGEAEAYVYCKEAGHAKDVGCFWF